ncbi:MAG TPA: hypothetical protein V6C85_37730 [Allocoleopsis sp.]
MKLSFNIYRVIRFWAIALTSAFVACTVIHLEQVPKALSAQVAGNERPATVTYTKNIAPILFQNCATCHRPGQIAPFSLLTYKDAAEHAKQLASATTSRYMPPWKPEPGYGSFQNERRLTEQDIALIQQWAETGAVEGNPSDLPLTPKFAEGWQLGKPDLIVKMPQAYTLQAEGNDQYQCFVLPLNFPKNQYVSAVEVKPGNPKIVHHSILYQAPSDEARKLDGKSSDVGYPCFGGPGQSLRGQVGGVASWVPGSVPHYLLDGVAAVIKQGDDLILQNHYHRDGNIESDQSVVGIYFAKSAPQKVALSIPLIQTNLDIPPGEKRYQATASFTAPIDLQVIEIGPHMHLLGHEMKVTATLPDGTVKPMIWIKDWDFHWQGRYQYKQPVNLPKGTRLEMVAYYNNSVNNPNNPNHPPRRVTWGEQTTDEMALCGITVAAKIDNQDELNQLRQLRRQIVLSAREYLRLHRAQSH